MCIHGADKVKDKSCLQDDLNYPAHPASLRLIWDYFHSPLPTILIIELLKDFEAFSFELHLYIHE